jgi:hypothetical protein
MRCSTAVMRNTRPGMADWVFASIIVNHCPSGPF